MKPRLLIVASHPIQYQAPWFQALHGDGRIELKVMFLSLPDSQQQGIGFGHAFTWDVPLLDGYPWKLAPSAMGGIHNGWWGLRLRAAAADLAAQQPDAVLITGWQNCAMLQCLRAANRLRVPVLLRAESNGLAPLSLSRRLRSRWIAGQATLLLPIGRANRQFYEAIGLGHRLGLEVPYFVDNRFFAEHNDRFRPQRQQLREKFGIPPESFCFLFVGKFVDKKRPRDLFAALRHLALRTERPVHLLMVGTGTLEPLLKARTLTDQLPVSFAGFLNQTEVPAAYAAADCLVLPSSYGETWGLVVNEAMASRLPAIISDRIGCGPDLVSDGKTGFRFRCGSIGDLADKMTQVLAMDRAAITAMGENARHCVFAGHSIERAVENTVVATSKLTSCRGKGATD